MPGKARLKVKLTDEAGDIMRVKLKR